jgi:HEPN domain-containing protein
MEENEINYIVWQNRAFRFYLGSRLLYQKSLYSPAAFCSIQAIEALMKGTLVYWDKSFDPVAANHKIAGMIKSIKNKAKDAKSFHCPEYFYNENRYQSVSRYPANGKGLGIQASFLVDLDNAFYYLVSLVPFQFNSELKRVLSGKNKSELLILRRNNAQIRNLRKYLNVKVHKA